MANGCTNLSYPYNKLLPINKNKWIVLGRASHETNIYMFKSDDTRKIN